MQRFRYLTRQGNLVTSTDLDLILKEDNCMLVVNRGSILNPKPVFARREQGLVIEKEQEIDIKDLPNLLFDHNYLPIYYIGFTKSYISRLQKSIKKIEEEYEESKNSEEGQYNDFLKDLKRNRERWLLRQANVDKIREDFESNIKSNNISYIDENKKVNIYDKQLMDINDILDQEISSYDDYDVSDNTINELDFIPVKKVKK